MEAEWKEKARGRLYLYAVLDPAKTVQSSDRVNVIFSLTERGVANSVGTIKGLFEKYASPYYDQYSSCDGAESLLNRASHQERANRCHGHISDIILSGIILGKFLSKGDLIQIIRQHTNHIRAKLAKEEADGFEENVSRFLQL